MFEEKDVFEITPSTENFQSWSEKKFVGDDIRDSIKNASVLLVPMIGFRDRPGPSFPPGTEDLLAYLKANMPQEFTVDICVSDEYFATLSLHSDFKRLGNFNVKSAALGFFFSVLSGYIVNKITNHEDAKPQITIINNITSVTKPDSNPVAKKKIPKKRVPHKYLESPKVTFTITVEDTSGKSINFHYEGPAKEVDHITDKIKQAVIDGH